MSVNVLSVLKLNVKALKIKISMRYLKNIPKIHITWQKRGITYVLAHAFGIIPVVTDNPDYIRMFKVKKKKRTG